MDLSMNYIKMASLAKEIQKNRSVIIGNYYYSSSGLNVHIVGKKESNNKIFNINNYDIRNEVDYIWLPTQYQLQQIYWHSIQNIIKDESMVNYPGFLLTTLESLNYFASVNAMNKVFFFSFEQLWLAFVMYEMYLTLWDRKLWHKLDLDKIKENIKKKQDKKKIKKKKKDKK